MQQVTVVGAGLAGLTAAIVLAREGYEVTVLEQEKAIGGASLVASEVVGHGIHVADMTPLDLEAMNRYLGFSLTESGDEGTMPFYNPLPVLRFHLFGKLLELPFPPSVPMKMVERGPRASSLDMYLYRQALACGVNFSFGESVRTRQDFDDLPPGSIVATGMFREAFEALKLPHTNAQGHFAGGPALEGRSPFCVAYYNEHTQDYAYYASANGSGAAILFQRGKPLTAAAKEWFPRQLMEDEGIEFSDWHTIEDLVATPTGSFYNPRLYWGNLILAGTLAGMQDPSMVIGVHGALVSGKIAAMAVHDREAASAEFRRMNRWWKEAYVLRRLLWATHPWFPRLAIPTVLNLARHTGQYQKFLWLLNPAVPGWLRLPK